jgi:glutamine cyclotransferase
MRSLSGRVVFGCLAALVAVRVSPGQADPGMPPNNAGQETTPIYTYRVVNTYPHDHRAFTQGLAYDGGFLFEGTGQRGRSELRRVELETGKILQARRMPSRFFGEGVTVFARSVVQLTWQSHVGFVYDKDNFRLQREFTYPTEGWGITHDGQRLVMSDGTSTLRFLDPATLAEVGRIRVYDSDGAVTGLNELEYVKGEIFSNVWRSDCLVRIDPETGRVVGVVNLEGLLRREDRREPTGVLNGIAYDASRDRLFVTGKLWPRLFEIALRGAGRETPDASASCRR